MATPWNDALDTVVAQADKPAATVTLASAGLVPVFIDLNSVQLLYFALLIPPAAYHCYKVIVRGMPTLLGIIKWIKSKI